MKKTTALLLTVLLTLVACTPEPSDAGSETSATTLTLASTPEIAYRLPPPISDGEISLESALAERRSRRNFSDAALTQQQLSQILWSAYGITSESGLRTAPSAGALYPLEVYAVVGNVEGIAPGVYRYDAASHALVLIGEGDIREQLRDATFGQQQMVADAPLTVFYSGVFERSTVRYGERGIMYTHIEVGHSAQNVYLQVEALGLGTCAIGAFHEDAVRALLNLPAEETPLYLLPVGVLA
jgi:SagB-type dehydrogenase family enzyme